MVPPWRHVLEILAPGRGPKAVQFIALKNFDVLNQRRNLIVAAPTNAGKTLIGLLVLLDAVRRGQRAVLLEPLRAIAREKFDELQALRPALEKALQTRLRVRITTGDYRRDNETFAAPPPDRGELIIATPERLDAIQRDPAHDPWFAELGAVAVDEAHLLRSPGRGATLECLITSLLCLPCPPRMVLMSASLGNVSRGRDWLAPCDVIRVAERNPPLRKGLLALEETESPDDAIAKFVADALADDAAQVLVFVYQTRSAELLAARLPGNAGALAYHARMSAEQREEVRQAFLAGRCRCLVTSTALALGVNLPATHVCIRDVTFPGVGVLRPEEILQMMGRAGRGEQTGHAVVIVRPTDRVQPEELARVLREERLPELASAITIRESPPHVLARLARCPEQGLSAAELKEFFARSLGGKEIARQVRDALDWLTDPRQILAYADEQGRFHPTVLGRKASRGMLPLPVAAGYGRLIRDLLSLENGEEALETWQPLDHLLVLELTYPRAAAGTRFGERLVEQVDAGMMAERSSCLYRHWITKEAGVRQLLSSLGAQGKDAAADRKTVYLACFRAISAWERQEEWEERRRDDLLWLLAGLEKILEVRCFYYHLKEECGADAERVRRADRALRRMRRQTFELRGQLKK